jgi:hypothetical protein
MTAALKDKPVLQFPVPDGIEYAKVCATTGEVPTSSCPKTVTEVFMSGHLPSGAKAEKPGSQQSAPAPKATAVPQIVAQPSPTPQPVLLPPTPQIPPQQLQPQLPQQAGQPPFPGIPTQVAQTPQVQQIPQGLITPIVQATPRITTPPSQPTVPPGFVPGPPGGGFQPNSRPTSY